MSYFGKRQASWRRARIFVCVCAICCVATLLAASPPDQPPDDAVGVIEGADIAITGPMSVDMVGGQVKTILRSGSDVRVKSGQARINLVESGQISICGPAHFSVLKAGGSLTLALESGIVHMRLDRAPAVTVYTAQIQAQPVAIGAESRDFLMGFENPGVMCIRTYRGAMRLEQQLSGQSMMVPEGGDILLANGQIDSLQNGGGYCHCELEMAKATPPAPLAPAPVAGPSAVGAAGNNAERTVAQGGSAVEASDRRTPRKEPAYQVSLPPLTYDATARVQPSPDPRLMAIVRKLRVRPTLIFQGKVEGAPVATAAAAPPAPPPAAATPTNAPSTQSSVMGRVRSFFRRLWTRTG
ncbi:MAG TPA: hypothetical protein VE077_19660 [Candidatus Methylomirabilis sp.]|nr:hypothetical protein [Candidatus Methylomirabilis sp.]